MNHSIEKPISEVDQLLDEREKLMKKRDEIEYELNERNVLLSDSENRIDQILYKNKDYENNLIKELEQFNNKIKAIDDKLNILQGKTT